MQKWECEQCEVEFWVEKGAAWCPYCGSGAIEYLQSFIFDVEE